MSKTYLATIEVRVEITADSETDARAKLALFVAQAEQPEIGTPEVRGWDLVCISKES